MKHLDLFSGVEAMTNLNRQDCNACGQLGHGKSGKESIPYQELYSSLTAKNHYADVVAYEQCQGHEPHHRIGKPLEHQGISIETVSYCHPCHTSLVFWHSILGTFGDCVHRTWNETALHFALHIHQSSAVYFVDPIQERNACHIDGKIFHPLALSLYSLGIFVIGICESSICAMRFQLQRVYHKLCSIWFYLQNPCSYLHYNKLVGMLQGKGGA